MIAQNEFLHTFLLSEKTP